MKKKNEIIVPIATTRSHVIDQSGNVYNIHNQPKPREKEPAFKIQNKVISQKHDPSGLHADPIKPQKGAPKIGNVLIDGRLHYLNRATGIIEYIYPQPYGKWDSITHGSMRGEFTDHNANRPLYRENHSTTYTVNSPYYYTTTNTTGEIVGAWGQKEVGNDFIIPEGNKTPTQEYCDIQCGQMFSSNKCKISKGVCNKSYGKHTNKTLVYSGNYTKSYRGIWGRDCNASPSMYNSTCNHKWETCQSILDFKANFTKSCLKTMASCQSKPSFKPYCDINEFNGWINHDMDNFVEALNSTVIGRLSRIKTSQYEQDGYGEYDGWHYDYVNRTQRIHGNNPPINSTTMGWFYYSKGTYKYNFETQNLIYHVFGKGISKKYAQVFNNPYTEKYVIGVGDSNVTGYGDYHVVNSTSQAAINAEIKRRKYYNAWDSLKTINNIKNYKFPIFDDYTDTDYNETTMAGGGACSNNTFVYGIEASACPLFTDINYIESDWANFDNLGFKRGNGKFTYANNNTSLLAKYRAKKITVINQSIIDSHLAKSTVGLRSTVYNETTGEISNVREWDYKTTVPLTVQPLSIDNDGKYHYMLIKNNIGWVDNYALCIFDNKTTVAASHYLPQRYSCIIDGKWTSTENYHIIPASYYWKGGYGSNSYMFGTRRDTTSTSSASAWGTWVLDKEAQITTDWSWSGFDIGRKVNYDIIHKPQISGDKIFFLNANLEGYINLDYPHNNTAANISYSFLGISCYNFNKYGIVGQKQECTITNPTLNTFWYDFKGVNKSQLYEKDFPNSGHETGIIPYNDPSGLEFNYGSLYTNNPRRSNFKEGNVVANWVHDFDKMLYTITATSTDIQYVKEREVNPEFLKGDYYIDYYMGYYYLYVWCFEVLRDAYMGIPSVDPYSDDYDYMVEIIPTLWRWKSDNGITFTKGKRVTDLRGRYTSCRYSVAKCKNWNDNKAECTLPNKDCHIYKTNDWTRIWGIVDNSSRIPYCIGNGYGVSRWSETEENATRWIWNEDNKTFQLTNYTYTVNYHFYSKTVSCRLNESYKGSDKETITLDPYENWKNKYGWLGDYGIKCTSSEPYILIAKKYQPDIIVQDNNNRDPENSNLLYTNGFDHTNYHKSQGWNKQDNEPTWNKQTYSPQAGKNVIVRGGCIKANSTNVYGSRYKPWCFNQDCINQNVSGIGAFAPRFPTFLLGPENVFDY